MKLLLGLTQLVESPSGIFSLICLAILTGLSIHSPSTMVAAWVAFFGIIPTALGYFEHKETLAQIVNQTNVQVTNQPQGMSQGPNP